MMRNSILIICGPTAVGKSDIAVLLAEKYNGEIISADSRQVYKGMNIGTGKITEEEMKGIPHYMLDITDPKDEVFTAGRFKEMAEKVIDDILSRGKLPIICGGTGFYIESIVKGIEYPPVPANENLRKELLQKSVEELLAELQKLSPERAENIDSKNKVRLIRAIEIAKFLGNVPKVSANPKYNCLQIGIDAPDEILKARIHNRLIKRIDAGMIEEVKDLIDSGVSLERLFEFGLEYRYISEFLQNKIGKNEMISKLEMEIWHYAKRQRTWFKKDKTIKWFRFEDLNEIEKAVEGFLQS